VWVLLTERDINELIQFKFDFGDDEILPYYISLLKTLALKLNERTIVFFFNPVPSASRLLC
jgi:protein CLEC16A